MDFSCKQYTKKCFIGFMSGSVPIATEFLQWSRSCESLVRLVNSNAEVENGTTYVLFANVLLFDRAVSIGKLECVQESSCARAPGTVVAIEENSWRVSTADGVVKISDFLDEFGQPVSAQAIANECHVIEGGQLPIITPEQAERLAREYGHSISSVSYWFRQLTNFERSRLSFISEGGTELPIWASTACQYLKDFSALEVLTAWLIYIVRDTQMPKIQIGWDATESWHQYNGISTRFIFGRTVPFGTTIDLNDTFSGVFTSVKRHYNELVNHLPCLSHTLIRNAPDSNLKSNGPWPLAVSLIDTFNENEHFSTDFKELASYAHGSLMTLQISKKSGCFRWIYNQNQISEKEISRISSRLLALLESAHTADKANEPVAKLNLLPKAERNLLLYTLNQTTVANPLNRCFHQVFEEQVNRDGNAVAVECNGESLSYSKLNTQSNRLAHYLIARGVKPDDRIALCIERSIAVIVAMLGILKAGGAYVPLDPIYPSQRLTHILKDANPKLLLVDAIGRKSLGEIQTAVVDIKDQALFSELPADSPDSDKLELSPDNLAYVIYTSGSTGTPKGVMIEHRSLFSLIRTMPLFEVNPDSRILQFSSCSFDNSIWEIVMALASGARLCMPYGEERQTDTALLEYITEKGVTHADIVPAIFQNTKDFNGLSGMKLLIFGGESPTLPLLTAASQHTVIYVDYGPTEATVNSTYWPYSKDFPGRSIPIGRPLPSHCRIYLLDSHGEPVPLGAEGEIYIGGAGVARGYLNRPELTAERFLFDPFSVDPTARMYRTGDRARYLPDRNLVYLGRIDQQVKVRGFRIELGEIEAHLVAHPQLHAAVIQPHSNGSDTRLVAYVVTDADSSIAQDLRNYLSSLLPDYMVPAAYVCLPSLPLTPNGKVDRRALPPPVENSFVRQRYEAPQSGMERKLADIWHKLLGIDRISRHDNFFALGGHSLLVARLLAELRQIGMNSSVREVFDAASLAMLAATLTRYQAINIPSNLITEDNTAITPEMLPLISLSRVEIDAIVSQVPGGIANIQDIYGLTPIQSGMLFHHLKADRGDLYLITTRMEFIDSKALKRYADALQKVIERHDIFRTMFIWENLSESVQVVLRRIPSLLTEITLNDTDELILQQLSHRFHPSNYRLDLTKAPLLRLMASPISDGRWVAVQLMHHIIADLSSDTVLASEIHAVYDDQTENLPTPMPFRQVVTRSRLDRNTVEHTRFFTEMLGDVDEPTLPFGLCKPALNENDVNEAQLMLPQTLYGQLREHARKLQVSLASICHLAWGQVLARASNREAVVFGTVLLGRLQNGESNNDIMGPMINTLPIRIDVDERSVKSAVRHTHARLSGLLEHEQAPLVLAQRCSAVSAELPLFSALLNYIHNQQNGNLFSSIPGLTVIDECTQTNYPLSFSVEDDSRSLNLKAQIILPMSAIRICGYMQRALQSLADALMHTPQQPVRTLTVIPPEERTLLLHDFNPKDVFYSPALCLHQLQVECDPQAIALEFNGEFLSYSELNIQANRLAHYLIAEGVKPDDCIALCVDRSTAMIVAMLGILKAGAAYVPLDPVYSSQRLTNILQDANPKILLTDVPGRQALGDHEVPVFNLEKEMPADMLVDNPDATSIGLTPRHLAYVIYTSGSTGTPKGVMVEHQHIVQQMEDNQNTFDFDKEDRMCMLFSMGFDTSLWDIWSAFLIGCQLSIVPLSITQSADKLYEWICARGITVLGQIPSAFKMLMRAGNISFHSHKLRYIIFGGEAFDPMILTDWHEENGDSQTVLVNMYGPTETVIDATSWICDMKITENLSVVPIGRPLPSYRIYLLDAHGQLVPLGAEGELYIGGVCVARGYLNRPELTTERFLPDPFSAKPATRMYRTGDRARYLPDGNLVYLGRTDQQVKIRGFRIELGEIQTHLATYPQVREAVVQPHGNGSDTRLVAYVVTDADQSIAQELRNYLSTLLPRYMIPASYVCLPCLPLTPNGKLDHRALPDPDDYAFVRQQYESPQNDMEEKLADIWSELLGIERISRHDNFFALGGHSLLVVRLMAQLRQSGLDTTVREIFDSASLATLAATLIRYQAVDIPPNLITADSTEITPEMLPLITLTQREIDAIISQVPGGVVNIQDIYGLTCLQHGMLFHHIKTERGDVYLTVSRMQFNDRKTLDCYVNALQHMIHRHDVLRSVFIWEGLSEPAQIVLRQVPSLLNETLIEDAGESILQELSTRYDPSHFRLDLAQAPLLRLIASPSPDGNWMALQLMHHSIIDNLSNDILETEIRLIINGQIERLTAPTPFRNFVAQTRLGISPAEHKSFFTNMLGDINEPTLPFGLSDVSLDGTKTNVAHLVLPKTLNDQLREHARNLHISLASIFHLSWAQVLARASGREAVVFGTVLFGGLKTGEENNNIMGPMINTLPIRIEIDERSVETAFRHTHLWLSSLLAHENAPLTLAQRCSGVSKSLPLFSAILNYRHNKKRSWAIAKLPGIIFFEGDDRTNYPIVLSVEDNSESFKLMPQVISPLSADRICGYVQHTLETLVHALLHTPQQMIRALAVIPPEEYTLLLHTWNQFKTTSSPALALHQLFENQIDRNGQAIAVECDVKSLSYSELNAQANRLARYLITRGVKPNDRIAICFERSTTLIVAMLGVLKAGGAYVPLDPVYSSQRLTHILNDAEPTFLLADTSGRRALGDHQVLVIDLDEPLPEDLPIHNPNATEMGVSPANLAYIIYTSGSTGTPKGVMIEHQHIVRLFEATKDKFGFNKDDKWSLFHSISFDFSVWEIWGALSAGSQLSIVPYSVSRSPEEFYDWICSNRITILNQTPSAFRMLLLSRNMSSRSDQLRYIIFGGEVLDPQIVKAWHDKDVNAQTILANVYGPTETAIIATIWMDDNTVSENSVIPIGRSLLNKPLYLLDAHGELVPLGAEGVLHIGGNGVARGYLNRPELNAKRFLPDPFNAESEARMYRTGDRARYLPDGNLIYLGRNDQQVKIRGFRIELGEIEAHLIAHHQVREAVVQSHGNGSDARLVAYVATDAEKFLAQDLCNYLTTLLPGYMVPTAYVHLPSLPLTPNGKLDRRALPVPDEYSFVRQQYEVPQGETEKKLADIWRELLNIERIGRHDNFFELGGHSLLVMQLINKAKQCNIHIDARGIYSYPILKDLAEQITHRSNRLYCDVAIPVRRYGSGTPLFLLPDGDGGISYAELGHDIDESIPVYVLPWSSPESKQPATLGELANEMIGLIKSVQPNGPYAIAGYSGGGILAYDVAKQLIGGGSVVTFVGLLDSYAMRPNFSGTVLFLTYVLVKLPALKHLTDSEWWTRVCKMTINEAINEIKKSGIDLTNANIEWIALLSRQRHNYQNLCGSYEIKSLPIRVHLFKAANHSVFLTGVEQLDGRFLDDSKKLYDMPQLGWENYNLPTDFHVVAVDGDHFTMMTDPKNRSLLGRHLTNYLKNLLNKID